MGECSSIYPVALRIKVDEGAVHPFALALLQSLPCRTIDNPNYVVRRIDTRVTHSDFDGVGRDGANAGKNYFVGRMKDRIGHEMDRQGQQHCVYGEGRFPECLRPRREGKQDGPNYVHVVLEKMQTGVRCLHSIKPGRRHRKLLDNDIVRYFLFCMAVRSFLRRRLDFRGRLEGE